MSQVPPDGVKERASRLPEKPGCYLFRTAAGQLLYVGKAKNLRRRVLNYFQRSASLAPRTRAMMSEVATIEIILSGSEVEALILENSLIKRHRPRYNVMLRDDKNFPYLKLTSGDPFPRVVLVRQPRSDGHLYFGPYIPASLARRTLKMTARFFQVATCHERFDGSRSRPCILYQMHQCLAPCVHLVDESSYARAVGDVRLFLEGRRTDLSVSLRSKMQEAAHERAYEQAARYRDLLATVKALSRRQSIASVGLEEQDYFGFHMALERAALQVFQVRGGLVQSRREYFLDNVQGGEADLMSQAMSRYYATAAMVPRRLFTSVQPAGREVLELWLSRMAKGTVRIRCPQRGVHHHLMQTLLENARQAWEDRYGAGRHPAGAVQEALRDLLGLAEIPVHVEGFDISHIQGSQTVASVVVWEGGRPRRAAYRRMRIKNAAPGDDYAAMSEAVLRRYRRQAAEGRRLPDLVLIDGGRGQLGAATAALAELGIETVPAVALAKRQEDLFVPGRVEPLPLSEGSPVRLLLTRIRDEAHRFAISYHRQRRRRRTLSSALLEVPGIGQQRARLLLREFGSLEGVRNAHRQDLVRVVGRGVARALEAHLVRDKRPSA